MTSEIVPGFLALHGNRLEQLRDAVADWLARAPLAPLEEEHLLVPSNGAAEWLKMSLAQTGGICAATRVELPARFLWRTYRQMLGRDRVPAASPLDEGPLVWRLMRLLPTRLGDPAFAPLAGFLRSEDGRDGDDLGRRLQFARRLADLFDQYQVYRADWLSDWAGGRDVLRSPRGAAMPVPATERWQPALWRALVDELRDDERGATRAAVHRDFLAAIESGASPREPLPRRVVVFGTGHVPGQTLEALAALASRAQVLMAVPNPCRYHWADIVGGRELLRAERRRHACKGSVDLAAVPLEAMHAHAHPLLTAWGRQGRDFMRLLDTFDDTERLRHSIDLPRVDLFDDDEGATMLEQAQAAIRDLVPLAEHPARTASAADRSIVFHVAHGPQREVEVLHDQLLTMFAATAGTDAPLKPRDVVVMVPDIDTFAAQIRAVFGQHAPGDPRRIPFGIVDIRARRHDPLVVALDWLLRAPAQRFRHSEVHGLLEVPAIARRFGLSPDDVPTLSAWIAGAGVRWGLAAGQRADLDLEACGELNTWAFGLRRMLLGYASGEPFAGIEPYDEIGGLDAALVGPLADFIDRLAAWTRECRGDATATVWARRGRALLSALFEPADEAERLGVAAIEAALAGWLDACEGARFDEPVPLAVFCEAWLAAVDPPGGGRRFLAGGVTFCTLMPLRAVPFQVVCLLGMNDGAYPRPDRRVDFDLMGLPGQQRPGDRSRRDDDRYLMLEALLSARRVFYVSWSGRSARDNSDQPPSVLVSQLRDYLRAAWPPPGDDGALAMRTTVHPLQPFSRRYFDADADAARLVTHAREWRAAHRAEDPDADTGLALPALEPAQAVLGVVRLARFLKKPVKTFFRERLSVSFDERDDAADDEETFALDGLQRYGAAQALLAATRDAVGGVDAEAALRRGVEQLRGAGRLPIGEVGAQLGAELTDAVAAMLEEARRFEAAHPTTVAPARLRFEAHGVVVDDWLDGARAGGGPDRSMAWLELRFSRLLVDPDKHEVRGDKLIEAWVRAVAAAACGQPLRVVVVGSDATLRLPAIDADGARATLGELLSAWAEGMQAPLPLPARTALAFVGGKGAAAVYEGGHERMGEVEEPCLARTWPTYAELAADGRFEALAGRVYTSMVAWLDSVGIERHAGVGLLDAARQASAEAVDG